MKKLLTALLFGTSCLLGHDITLYHHKDHLSTDLMQKLIKIFSVDVLVETGTSVGDTASNASSLFKEVHTVELDRKTFSGAKKRLAPHKNVYLYLDNSFNFLSYDEVACLENPLFWLDAHYSGGNTGTLYNEKNWVLSPLKKELEIILSYWSQKGAILIDDLRGYLNLRSEDKEGREYTTVSELYRITKSCSTDLEFYVLGDMGLIFNKKYYSVDVSPYVKACTVSYTFNPHEEHSKEDVEELLQAENVIRKAEPSEELDGVISMLCEFPLVPADWSGYYPTIWHGLRSMGRGDYLSALKDFQKIVTIDCSAHSRMYLYLAECHKKLGDLQSMQVCMSSVDDEVKECAKTIFEF